MRSASFVLRAAGLAALIVAAPAMGALVSSDNADDPAYAGGWNSGTNGGFGWQPWVIQTDQASGASGSFLAGGGNGDLNNIKSPNHAWGTYANGGGFNKVAAHRRLTGDAFNTNNLVTGQSITILMEHGSITSANDGAAGFVGVSFGSNGSIDPFSSGLTGSLNSRSLLGFFGGEATYKLIDQFGVVDTGVGFRNTGLSITFTLVNDFTGEYRLSIVDVTNSMNLFTSGPRFVNGGVDRLSLYNWNAEFNDAFFNTISLVPAPGAAALLGLGGLMAGRRRRA